MRKALRGDASEGSPAQRPRPTAAPQLDSRDPSQPRRHWPTHRRVGDLCEGRPGGRALPPGARTLARSGPGQASRHLSSPGAKRRPGAASFEGFSLRKGRCRCPLPRPEFQRGQGLLDGPARRRARRRARHAAAGGHRADNPPHLPSSTHTSATNIPGEKGKEN